MYVKKLNISYSTIKRYMKHYGIVLNVERGRSNQEFLLENWIKLMNIKYMANDRNTLKNHKELDFLFPDNNVAIELGGFFFHSNLTKFGKKDKFYYFNKWK